MNCTKCGNIMKLIPAGVSKKNNKPYPAFYTCPDKSCGNTYNPPKATTPMQGFKQEIDVIQNEVRQDNIRKETNGSIRWCNALNNATLLMCHGKVNRLNETDTLSEALERIATQIYNLQEPE